MAIRNYLKVFADGHTEATVEKPSFGEVSATGDYYINGLWYDKLGVAYPTQFTYASQDDKLATFLVEDGQPVDITFDDDSPSIVQDVIQAKDMVVVDKLKINNTEWLNDGVDYDDPDAIGANPVAKIYPDGTIVGSTDNGDYIKYPNGGMEVMCAKLSGNSNTSVGSVFFEVSAVAVTFPIVFTAVTDAQVTAEYVSGSQFGWTGCIDSITNSTARSRYYTPVSGGVATMKYNIKGTWK